MINKFFNKMQHRMLLLLILSTLIPVFLVGWYGIYSSTAALQNLALISLNGTVNSSANQMIDKLENRHWFPNMGGKDGDSSGLVR